MYVYVCLHVHIAICQQRRAPVEMPTYFGLLLPAQDYTLLSTDPESQFLNQIVISTLLWNCRNCSARELIDSQDKGTLDCH